MKTIRKFLKDRSGATAVTFALLLVPIMGATGLAVDYSRASGERTVLQSAADAAVLSGAAIYDGKNLPAVKTRIHESLRANLAGYDDSGATHDVSVVNDKNISLLINRPMNTLFMRVLNKDIVDISVRSEAFGGLKPTDATLTIKKVKGIYYKKISMIGIKEDGTEDVIVSLEYSNPKQIDFQGETVPPVDTVSQTLPVGKYKELYFTMLVKKEGCGIGQKREKKNNQWKCVATTSSNEKLTTIPDDLTYEETVTRQNNAHAFLVQSNKRYDAWRLALDGAQTTSFDPDELPEAITMNKLFKCDGTVMKHGWEDGGGGTPDFEYEVKSGCVTDNSNLRLTQ